MNTTANVSVGIDIPFERDKYGFLKQINPKDFEYDLNYKSQQSTNIAMSWLRLGWLSSYIPVSALKTFNAVDIGAGNLTFVKEAAKVFRRCVPYDLAGESIGEDELYQTEWDLIVMSDVLEHYHNIDDLWRLKFRYALISFPEAPIDMDLSTWRHYKPDEHIYMLTAVKFSEWVELHGHSVVGCGCPEDLLRRRWDSKRVNISTFLIKR